MNMVTVGIDLAKNIFAFHGIDQNGKDITSRLAAMCHRSTASVDVKRVGPARGAPDQFKGRQPTPG